MDNVNTTIHSKSHHLAEYAGVENYLQTGMHASYDTA